MSDGKTGRIGYVRVSTQEHDPALQLNAPRDAGCVTTFEDRASGACTDHPGLRQAFDYIRAGNVLTVWSWIDWAARSRT